MYLKGTTVITVDPGKSGRRGGDVDNSILCT